MSAGAKHTPGPWAIGGVLQNTGDVTISAPQAGIVVADVHNAASLGDFVSAALSKGRFGHADDADTQWANARLIAAAPDLLATLKVIIARENFAWAANGLLGCDPSMEDAMAAIAKAEGRA